MLRVSQERPRPDPATFLGRGKLDFLAAACAEADVDAVIFDNELTPAQLREIEAARRVGRSSTARSSFSTSLRGVRARAKASGRSSSRSSNTCLPRLVGAGAALSRLGGGIGTRGPGETKLETDRRRIRVRIQQIRKSIDELRRRRAQLRGASPQAGVADRRARRLHQRRQDDHVQPADARGRRRAGRVVRHARSAGAASPVAGSPRPADLRHRRVHRSPCRTRWSPHFARRSKKSQRPTSCCT